MTFRFTLSGYITLIAFLLTPALTLNAVPAKKGILTITQADGSTLRVRLTGDEWSHQYLTEDGFPLQSDNGTFRYARLEPSGELSLSPMAATDIDRRAPEALRWLDATDKHATLLHNAEKASLRRAARAATRSNGLFSEVSFPTKGKQKGLVILVEYKDVKFTVADPHDYFSRMLNEPGFSDYGGTGSARDYFIDSSCGQFDPEFTLLGPVTMANNMAYYGGNKANGDDRNAHRMAVEACQQLDAVVDFSEYDRDGDGVIDNVFIFYAGKGEASGGGEDTVWPHTWYVASAESTPYVFDGVTLDRYACSNEWEDGHPDGVGTFCHEFSHVLGLPDLYSTSYSSAFTPGDWAVMDHGSYNNNGRTPPAYSSFERYAVGWITPRELSAPANITMRDISSNSACIIKTPDEDEFYLFENRQQTGWDTYLPGHGMLVWHIHYDPTAWQRNKANNDASHQHIDLIEADNLLTDESREADAFPGPAGVTEFTDNSTPAMVTWCGATLNLPLTEITETGRNITFKVAGGVPDLPKARMLQPTDITPGGFTVGWEPVEGAESYELEIYSIHTSDNGRPVTAYVSGYSPRNVGNVTSHTVTGLTPSTDYRLSVTAVASGAAGKPSDEMAVTTSEATFDYLTPVALEATDITTNSFTAAWEPLDGAAEYFIDVYGYTLGEPNTDTADFTGGLAAFTAAGWSTDSRMPLENASYAGAATPSLRLSANGSYIDSPVFSDDIRAISFWHRGIAASGNNALKVMVMVNDSWTDLTSVQVSNNAGGLVSETTDIPAGARALRITYSMPEKGSVAIDDITVRHGGEKTETPVAPYSGYSAGNSTWLTVDGLEPMTEYFYRVTAADASGTHSRRSGEIAVTTLKTNGIDLPMTAGGDITAEGRTLTLRNTGSFIVTDIAGRVIAEGEPHDTVSIALPAAGIYIVSTDRTTAKIAVR